MCRRFFGVFALCCLDLPLLISLILSLEPMIERVEVEKRHTFSCG